MTMDSGNCNYFLKKSVHGWNTFNHVKNRLNQWCGTDSCGADNFIQHLLCIFYLLECSINCVGTIFFPYKSTRATSQHVLAQFPENYSWTKKELRGHDRCDFLAYCANKRVFFQVFTSLVNQWQANNNSEDYINRRIGGTKMSM